MPFSKTELPGSILLELVDVPRPQFSYVDPPSGRWVTLDLTGVPYMTLWSDGGPFLCVEPCWGLPDHHEQRAFEQKEGIQTIPPGGELRASLQHDSAICVVRLGNAVSEIAVASPPTLFQQSEHKRNDAFGSSPIIRIPLGELLQHQFFFVAKFNPETRKH